MFRFCFNPKATQNARYEQMSKQQQLIEQKKIEIQKKIEEKKRKDAEQTLKKIDPEVAVVVERQGSNASARSRWKGKRNADVLQDETPPVTPTNIFSNDGSFLDQFRKMTGMKASKVPKSDEDIVSVINSNSTSNEGKELRKEECKLDTVQLGDGSRIEIYNRTHHSDSQDKIKFNRWDKSKVGNDNTSSRYPLQSQLETPQLSQSYHLQVAQPPPGHQSILLNSPPPLPPVPPPSFNQPQCSPVSASVFPVQIVPTPLRTSSIPPPAPINPGTIPSPSPILPCSIPSPSPIQPSAIPPPSPIIPHSIPPPSPITPNLIPPPASLPPSQQHVVSLHMIPPPSIAESVSPSCFLDEQSNIAFPVGVPPLPPPTATGMPAISYPLLKPTCDKSKQLYSSVQSGSHHRITVPAEQTEMEIKVKHEECGRDNINSSDENDLKKEWDPDNVTSGENLFCFGNNEEKFVKIKKEVIDSQLEEAKIRSSVYAKTKKEKDCHLGIKYEPIDEFSKSEQPMKDTVNFENEIQPQQEENSEDGDSSALKEARRKKRKSRWAPESESIIPNVGPIGIVAPTVLGATPVPTPSNTAMINVPGMKGPLISQITRTDPALLQYAIQNFGSTQLSEEDWKKAEDHFKINLLYQDMLKKRRELEQLEAAGKFKYEYDSDEETEGGTWEHKLREKEMEATQLWAQELTEAAKGKHHIGDFLPPEELSRFMEKYEALKQGRPPDLSDYKEYKLKEDNIGFQMLQKLGWIEGQGLGSDGSGIVDPVNKATVRADNQGLGLERPEDVADGDDEYDAYRKRMMLAYRFRPNPLNNPRRPYY